MAYDGFESTVTGSHELRQVVSRAIENCCRSERSLRCGMNVASGASQRLWLRRRGFLKKCYDLLLL